MTLIDRDDAIPLYHQLFLQLRDEIMSGRRAFGDSMPTEAELCDQYSVSRITARRALAELAETGLVERRRRTGTRVIFQSPARPLEADVDQAVEALVAFGRKTEVRLIGLDEGPASSEVCALLNLPLDALVVHARRLRSLDGEPLGLVSSWMPAAVAAHVPLAGLATTPILELLRGANLTIGSAHQTIAAELANAELGDWLQIPQRSALLMIERLVRDGAGAPMLLTRAHYRADRYRVTLDLGSSTTLHPSAPAARSADISSAE
ncbi:GntR family transcriptional regulator [Sphingobium sp. EM0848]|uniref:GntR family transcriptional regulator n=1 Tax=Sphingobium sp. EM0848 TaxID=2743473 RepID=UPI00159BF3D8|nr:GntR family transcriptional regulator [Sphingobium sp. EM0848]